MHVGSKDQGLAARTSAVVKYSLLWLGIHTHAKKLAALVLDLKVASSVLWEREQTGLWVLEETDAIG